MKKIVCILVSIVTVLSVASCARETSQPSEETNVIRYSDTLNDLDPKSLIGMDYREAFPLIYTERDRAQWTNAEPMSYLHGLRYQLRTSNLTEGVFPELAPIDFALEQTAPFTLVAACSKYDQQDDAYTIRVGYIPSVRVTPEVMQKAHAGEYNAKWYEKGKCDPDGGPIVPLSRVSSDK